MSIDDADDLFLGEEVFEEGPSQEDLNVLAKELENTPANKKARGKQQGLLNIGEYLASFVKYPVLNREQVMELLAEYREAVCTLRVLRLSGHVDPGHCRKCLMAGQHYDELKTSLLIAKTATVRDRALVERLTEQIEEAKEVALGLRRAGHVDPPHCRECGAVKRAINKLIERLMYGSRLFVAWIVKRMSRKYSFVDPVELLQEGMSAVRKVVADFNPSHLKICLPFILRTDELGREEWREPEERKLQRCDAEATANAAFSQLLSLTVRRDIKRYVQCMAYREAMRLSVHVNERNTLISIVRANFKRKYNGQNPTDTELLEAIHAIENLKMVEGVTLEHIELYYHTRHLQATSLNRVFEPHPRSPSSAKTLGDTIRDTTHLDPEMQVDLRRLMQHLDTIATNIERAARSLYPSYAYVIRNRLGIDQEAEAPTLKAVGQRLGLSRERVRQMQTNGLERLHKLIGVHPNEIELIIGAYTELNRLFNRRGKAAHTFEEGTVFLLSDEAITDIYGAMNPECFMRRCAALAQIQPEKERPFEMIGDLDRTEEQFERACHIVRSSHAQIRFLLALSHDAGETGGRYVEEPLRDLTQHGCLMPTEARYVLYNLIDRGWIAFAMKEEEPIQSGRGRIQVLWQENWPLDPPDRRVAMPSDLYGLHGIKKRSESSDPLLFEAEQPLETEIEATEAALGKVQYEIEECRRKLEALSAKAERARSQLLRLQTLHKDALDTEAEMRALLEE